MSTLWQDGNFETASADGPKRWLHPIDNTTMGLDVFEQDYMQLEANWTATPLDEPHPDNAGFFLVGEGPLSPVGGGIVKWTRTWAKIPASRTAYESYAWLVPGIGTESVYTDVSISSASNTAATTVLVTATSSTAAIGDSVSISYTFTDGITGTQYGRRVLRGMTAGNSTTVIVALIQEPGGTITFNTLRKVEPGRDAESLEVSSQVQIDYFLPGVSSGISTALDIPRISALEIYNNTGRKTNSFSATTSPALSAWRTQMATSALVCVTGSIIRPWLGNIFERSTRYCIAQ